MTSCTWLEVPRFKHTKISTKILYTPNIYETPVGGPSKVGESSSPGPINRKPLVEVEDFIVSGYWPPPPVNPPPPPGWPGGLCWTASRGA